MDPTYPPEAAEYREKIRAFLAEHLPADFKGVGALGHEERERFITEWRQTLADNKMLALNWPAEYGGPGLSPLETVIVHEEFARAGVPTGGENDGFSIGMVGNTMLVWGSEEQKKHFLPRILSGEDLWCQGYSEPNAGSDLANLGTRAVLDGDEWVINGQKIWTSGGHRANWIFVLCRTNPDAPKHKGISFILVPMDQPGVEVRPIKNIAGREHFNEVFFTDARAPRENVLGGENNGWAVAMTLLGFERGASASTNYLSFQEELEKLVELAKEQGVADDPRIRQRLAAAHTDVQLMKWHGQRVLTSFLAGERPGPEASIGKLFWSEYHKRATELAIDILGGKALLDEGDAGEIPLRTADPGTPGTPAMWLGTFYSARAGTIYAGTSQVQRNILGEQVLGLPKEPRADTGSWRESQKLFK